MIFVDTNVFVYAVGGPHPLREPARDFFRQALAHGTALCTSAEVLQELLHLYLGVERLATLDAALELVRGSVGVTWSVDAEDALLARALAERHPGLSARDLVHVACCTRREVSRVKTFDRALGAAMGQDAGP